MKRECSSDGRSCSDMDDKDDRHSSRQNFLAFSLLVVGVIVVEIFTSFSFSSVVGPLDPSKGISSKKKRQS